MITFFKNKPTFIKKGYWKRGREALKKKNPVVKVGRGLSPRG